MGIFELSPTGDLIRTGEVKGANIIGAGRTPLGLSLLTSSFSRSIRMRTADGRQQVLAHSGSGRASVSSSRAVAYDKRLDDGRIVIAYQRPGDHEPRVVTNGPTDMFPSFGADGRSLIFVRVGEGVIVSCELDSVAARSCRSLFADSLGPRFTTASPDGRLVAYQTTHGSGSRLRIIDMQTASMRDLGLYRSDCPPTWSSSTSLWLHDQGSSEWLEIEVANGHPTGRKSPHAQGGTWVCDRSPSPRTDFELDRLEVRETQIRVADGL
jgi:hypothetical protein